MQSQIFHVAALAFVDQRLNELNEEFGDLPEQLAKSKAKAADRKAIVEETQEILSNIRKFCSTSKITLSELREKEEKLAKKQFKVRNNKEFDAITKEIEHLKAEHEKLTTQLRTEAVKDENLMRILDGQKRELKEADDELAEKNHEYEIITTDQNEELNDLNRKRKAIVKLIDPNIYQEYLRVKTYHTDVAVNVKKNNCMGCFNAVPPQKIVECRNNLDRIFLCENCGRIIIPEDIPISEIIAESY